jgi:hypothetical protein
MGSFDLGDHSSSATASCGQVGVAVDAMGGDPAPGEIGKGAEEAARGGVHVILVGEPDRGCAEDVEI